MTKKPSTSLKEPTTLPYCNSSTTKTHDLLMSYDDKDKVLIHLLLREAYIRQKGKFSKEQLANFCMSFVKTNRKKFDEVLNDIIQGGHKDEWDKDIQATLDKWVKKAINRENAKIGWAKRKSEESKDLLTAFAR